MRAAHRLTQLPGAATLTCALLALAPLTFAACGSDSDDGSVATTGAGTDASDGVDGTDGATGADPHDNSCTADGDCGSSQACIESICVTKPTTEYKLTDNTTDEAASEGLELGCVGGVLDAPDGPATTTIYGVVDRFGGGRKTTQILVSVFLASSWPPADCTALPVEEQGECFRTQTSELKAVSVDSAVEASQLPDQCEKHKDCAPGYECVEVDVEYACSNQFGTYEIPNVPTNTMLVVQSRNYFEEAPLFESKWKDTYQYGIYIPADQVEADGRYNFNALMVSEGQWTTIPNTLFVTGGIKKNRGAVGGRIRDCGNAQRLGFTIGEASIGLARNGSATGYFNDNEEDTVPLPSRTATDIFGRFAAVDVPAGPNSITAAIQVDGKVVSLGSESFYLVPDSLAVVAFPGKKAILNK